MCSLSLRGDSVLQRSRAHSRSRSLSTPVNKTADPVSVSSNNNSYLTIMAFVVSTHGSLGKQAQALLSRARSGSATTSSAPSARRGQGPTPRSGRGALLYVYEIIYVYGRGPLSAERRARLGWAAAIRSD